MIVTQLLVLPWSTPHTEHIC